VEEVSREFEAAEEVAEVAEEVAEEVAVHWTAKALAGQRGAGVGRISGDRPAAPGGGQ
jgi:hypothetical protein